MMTTRAIVFLLVGVAALFVSNTADAQEQQRPTSSSGSGDGGYGGGHHGSGQTFLDLRALCDDSSDQEECLRRVAVCQRVHRTTARRPDMHHPSIVACANQLNITLPEVPQGSNAMIAYRRWARANPSLRIAIFECIHNGAVNTDGSVNRTQLKEGVRHMLAGEDEPELLQELLDRVQSCPGNTSRIEMYRCVLRGCASS